MRRALIPLLLFSTSALSFGNSDGQIDPSFGEAEGRTSIGYLESFTPDLRAFVRSSSNGQYWVFADDANDPSALYSARLDVNGLPDPGYGLGIDGRRRTLLPDTLIPEVEALTVTSAALQSDGKALVVGGLTSPNGASGAFPALICRLLTTGALDPSYDTDGCRTFRSQLASNEVCSVTDIAMDASDNAILVGNCSAPSIGERPFIARITSTGAFDTEFNGGIGIVFPAAPLASIESQHYASVVAIPDGRIAVLGEFVMFSNSVADIELGLAQFDNGGAYDDTVFNAEGVQPFAFDLGGDNHDRARDLVRRPDGRLLALGEARRTDIGGIALLLAQVTPAGAVDTAFGPGGKRSELLSGLSDRSQISALELDDLGRAVIAASSVDVDASANSRFGTEFRFGFVPYVPPAFGAEVQISSLVPATGTLESPHQALSIPFSVQPGVPTRIVLPTSINSVVNDDGVTARAIRITASAPVSVVATTGAQYSSANSLLTPVAHLGKRYRLSTWGPGAGVGSALVVAATEFDTTVTITPSVATDLRAAGVPFQIQLDPGEVYFLGANLATTSDLTGTTIVADKPISVLGGHSCAEVPDDAGNCDAVAEEQTPVERWGTRFFATPAINRPAGMRVRVLADRGPTHVWFDGELVASLQPGEFHDDMRTTATAIVTSQPALVTQFELGCTLDSPVDDCFGDPSMLTLEPLSRWSNSVLAAVREPFGDDAYEALLRIVLPSAAAGEVTIDAVPLPAANFSPIGNSGYSMAQIARAAGVYRITASAPLSVSVGAASESEGLAHNAAVITATPSSDDVLLRLRADGSRDPTFGLDGRARVDHTVLSGGLQNGVDLALRAIPFGESIVVASAFVSPVTQQHLPVIYRVAGASLFRDGFE